MARLFFFNKEICLVSTKPSREEKGREIRHLDDSVAAELKQSLDGLEILCRRRFYIVYLMKSTKDVLCVAPRECRGFVDGEEAASYHHQSDRMNGLMNTRRRFALVVSVTSSIIVNFFREACHMCDS
jgi:hypothetical protein